MRFCVLIAAALVPAPIAQSAAALPPDPDSRIVARRVVAGVRVDMVAESDGGRLVRMRRSGPGYRFDYSLEYWRGNGGLVVGATFRRGKCRSGEADGIVPTDQANICANARSGEPVKPGFGEAWPRPGRSFRSWRKGLWPRPSPRTKRSPITASRISRPAPSPGARG
jgi:hypothetical protein